MRRYVAVTTQDEFDAAVAAGDYPCVHDGSFTADGFAVVRAFGTAAIEAYDHARVTAYDHAKVCAHDDAIVTIYNTDTATVRPHDRVMVTRFHYAAVDGRRL